ncbi:unnamed protein product, partial [Ostreobium quekettii]
MVVHMNGYSFHVHDCAYIVLDWDKFEANHNDAEPCVYCGSVDATEEMLECDKCLKGYHTACLTPPLEELPPDDVAWICPFCETGSSAPEGATKTARELYLGGDSILAVCRIEALWEDANGEPYCKARWYWKPEETHTGRQRQHAAREIFLGEHCDDNPVDALLRPVQVLAPESFGKANEGDDVYLCRLKYNALTK